MSRNKVFNDLKSKIWKTFKRANFKNPKVYTVNDLLYISINQFKSIPINKLLAIKINK